VLLILCVLCTLVLFCYVFCSSQFVLASRVGVVGCCVVWCGVGGLLCLCRGLCFVVRCLGVTLPAHCFGVGVCVQDCLDLEVFGCCADRLLG